MTNDESRSDVTRRSLLKTTAGSLGVATVGQSKAQGAVGTVTSTSDSGILADRFPDQSRDAAVEWASKTFWRATGTATEFPGQVVFPEYSHHAITVLPEEREHIAAQECARAVTRLQDGDTGGFFRQQGDFLGPWTTTTYHAVSLARMFGISIDESSATEFLLDHQNDAGGFAPRSGFLGGDTIPTQEATYKATAALRRLDALSRDTRDRILAFVRSTQRGDGGWAATPRANASTVVGTYYALSVLVSLNALTSETARNASTFLRTLQQPTGGFKGKRNDNGEVHPLLDDDTSPSDQRSPAVTTRTTAQALLTLSRINDATSTSDLDLDLLRPDMVAVHTDWLVDRQLHQPNDDRFEGGFETTQDGTVAVTNYLLNTVFAMNALQSLNALDRIDRASASTFVAACQHPGSNGFASWPSSLSALVDTEAAVRALDLLGAPDRVPRDGLAHTLASQQRSDGSITQLDWDGGPTVEQTAQAVLALHRVGRLDAIDRTAAATFIADHQHETGGFTNTSFASSTRGDDSDRGPNPSIAVTWLAVRAVTAVDARARIDQSAVANYLAGLQGEDGHISSDRPKTLTAVRDTRYAMEILVTIGRLSAVDVDGAVSYLARRNEDDGYASRNEAIQVTIGLGAADALDAIDRASTRQYLREQQLSDGGFAKKGFYSGDTAMQRHAGAIEALHVLNAR